MIELQCLQRYELVHRFKSLELLLHFVNFGIERSFYPVTIFARFIVITVLVVTGDFAVLRYSHSFRFRKRPLTEKPLYGGSGGRRTPMAFNPMVREPRTIPSHSIPWRQIPLLP